jgi:Uma2 family endonuclease
LGVPVSKKSDSYCYKDYCQWPENERWELLDGQAYDMSPAPSRLHAEVLAELFYNFKSFFKNGACKVFVAPFDVRLPENDEADDEIKNVVQPDLLVICDKTKLDEKGCRGAPDLIVEVLSPSTASKDCMNKRAIYEKHGVKEYWTIDPINRMVNVYISETEGLFNAPLFYDDKGIINSATFKGLETDLSEIFPFRPHAVKQSPQNYL